MKHTEEEKLAIIEELTNSLEMEWGLSHYTYTVWNVKDNYHLVDFNKDGLVDIIYNGFVGQRNNGVMFFENRGDKYVKFMSFLGDIVEIWQSDIWAPLSFKLWNYRCCGNYIDFIETYVPNLTYQLNIKYELSNRIAIADGSIIPEEFESYQPFRTMMTEELYAFPSSDSSAYEFLFTDMPVVDSVPHSRYFNSKGSIIAWFDTSANGFILHEEIVRDSTWYFVMMSSQNRMRGVFCGKGDNNTAGYYMMGWIKAGKIELIPMKIPTVIGTKPDDEPEGLEGEDTGSMPAGNR